MAARPPPPAPPRLQVILTGEPALVSAAASLLLVVLQHNRDALAELHKTGLHFFALAYCGSNLRELARLLKVEGCWWCVCGRGGR